MFFRQPCGVLPHLLSAKGIHQPQHGGHRRKAHGGGHTGDGEDAPRHCRVKGGGLAVARQPQQRAGQPGGKRLPQLAGKGIHRVDGSVRPASGAQLRVINDIGDHGPDNGVEKAHAHQRQREEHHKPVGPGGAHPPAGQQHQRAAQTGRCRQAALAEPFGQRPGGGRAHSQNGGVSGQCRRALGGHVAVVVGEHIVGHAVEHQHGKQQQNGRQQNADERPAGGQLAQQLQRTAPLADRQLHPFPHQRETGQIACHRRNAEHPGNDRHPRAGQHLPSVHRHVSQQRRARADYHTRQRAADGAPGGQLGALGRVIGDGGGHGAVRNVDGCVKHRPPQQIGDEHPHQPHPVGSRRQPGLVNEEGGHRHRPADAQQPWPEPSVAGGAGGVHPAAHAHIGEGVHKAGQHHQQAHGAGGHAHHIGVKFHHKGGGQDKGKIVAQITEHIAHPVGKAEGALGGICSQKRASPFRETVSRNEYARCAVLSCISLCTI